MSYCCGVIINLVVIYNYNIYGSKIKKEEFTMKKATLWGVVATVCTLVATLVSTSACWFYLYQPEEPKCLQDK